MKLAVLVAAWVAGVLVGLEANAYLPAVALLSLAAAILGCLFWTRRWSLWPPLLALIMLMGILRVEAYETTPLMPSDTPQPIEVAGLIVSDPEVSGPGVEFVVSVDAVDRGMGWEDETGKVLVYARPPLELVQVREEPYFRYGDRLEIKGGLEAPAHLGDFDYGAYLASQGIHSTMAFPHEVRFTDDGGGSWALAQIYDVRRKLSQGIERALPEPQAALAQALLLGQPAALPKDVTEDFRSTGTSHLLAISGLHVGILLALALGMGAWLLGRRWQLYLLLPLASVWLYALVSGLSPSVERAAIMGTLYLAALLLGRPRSVVIALAVAAGVMAGVEPQVLTQVSFQLSFAAVAGIGLLGASRFQLWDSLSGISIAEGGWWRVPLRAVTFALLVSVAATVATLPLVAFNFQRIPTLGILATVLALPALPPLLVTSALAALVALINPLPGQLLGWVAWVPLEYVISLVRLFSKVPGSTFSVPAFSGLFVWVYYGALALLLLSPGGVSRLWSAVRRLPSSWEARAGAEPGVTGRRPFPVGVYFAGIIGLAVLAVILWYFALTGPDGKLHVHFLDVGQGDSVLIVTPEGRQVLVDGGPGTVGAARALGAKISFWDREIDMVVLTHPDEDHFRGLVEVLDRYEVDTVLVSGMSSENPLYLEWQRSLDNAAPARVTALQGQTVALDGSTWLEVLNPTSSLIRGTPSDSNNNGVVVRLVHGEVGFLLTADIEAEAERRLLRRRIPLRSTVLKVPHHGSRSSTTSRFLSEVSPAVAVISVGAGNPYGHPHSDVTGRLDDTLGEGRTYLTSERGDIEFITDGVKLWVKTSR